MEKEFVPQSPAAKRAMQAVKQSNIGDLGVEIVKFEVIYSDGRRGDAEVSRNINSTELWAFLKDIGAVATL